MFQYMFLKLYLLILNLFEFLNEIVMVYINRYLKFLFFFINVINDFFLINIQNL